MSPIDILQSHADHLIDAEQLKEKLKQKTPLKVKLGIDPTRADLTFGHWVIFNKLKQFQDLGHQCILIIGDYTATIGDPSGKSQQRPDLDPQTIQDNCTTYLTQAFKILDPKTTQVCHNSEWFNNMDFGDALRLARHSTVAQMLERDDFSQRYAKGTPISIVEFLYPLLQGYDSVHLKADIELGGTDQLFNLLVGRSLQRTYQQEPQVIMTLPLLVGLDGTHKMSKSLDNYIAFNDTPRNMFGKIMSIDDPTMLTYYELLLLKNTSEIQAIQNLHPMEAKQNLASEIVARFHGEAEGKAQKEHFTTVFSRKQQPDTMPEMPFNTLLIKAHLSPDAPAIDTATLMTLTQLSSSKKEARRLIAQGGVKLDGNTLKDPHHALTRPTNPLILQAGKRSFIKILPTS